MTERARLNAEKERKKPRTDLWECYELKETSVTKTITNSTLLIATFGAFIGFAYLLWVGLQKVGEGLASLDWDAFRDAIENLKAWLHYPATAKQGSNDQNQNNN